jgi:hypothetical protein
MAARIKDTFLGRNCGLLEPDCDEDGYYNGRLAPPDQAQFLYRISLVSMITGLIGIWYGWRWSGISICIGSVLAQVYWSDPTFSLRRTIDMSWLQVLIWSHLWLAWSSPAWWIYVAIQAIGVACYAASWWFIKQQSSWAATLLHGVVHVCANTSLLVLYTA